MCGIVGYVGDKSAVDIIVEAQAARVPRLRLRGHRGARRGTACRSGARAGRIKDLEALLRERPIDGPHRHRPHALGHPRPALRRERPSAHRLLRRSLVVVHNGIIENYLEIKERLQAEGHVFKSETDTEVLAHLIEHHLQDTPSSSTRR